MPLIIDTHCHACVRKWEPLDVLLFHMERSGIDKAVLIQYKWNHDNSYIVDAIANHRGRFSAAMIVPRNDDGSSIRSWHERGIRGIRLHARSRSDDGDILRLWRTAHELGIPVSVLGHPHNYLEEYFQNVLGFFDSAPLVLEHYAGAGELLGKPVDQAVFKQVMKLSRHENVMVKVQGFGEVNPIPLSDQALADAPILEMILEAFGPRRIMWGSDFPPVSTREGYDSSLNHVRNYIARLSTDEQEMILGGTAQRVWFD